MEGGGRGDAVGGGGERVTGQGAAAGAGGAAQCGKKFLGNSKASWAPAETGVSPNDW